MKPAIFSLASHAPLLAGAIGEGSAAALEPCEIERFADGELHVRLGAPVAGRVCGVLGSLAPPDEQLLSVLMLAHTLRRESARRVIALLPYLGYARQDRAEPGHSLGLRWAGELVRAAGVDRVVTLDVHSPRAGALGVPVDSLSPARLVAQALAREGVADLAVVAPDEGALERCEQVRRAAAIDTELVHMRKRRDRAGVAHGELVGRPAARAAIVDDILDTGGTVISACAALQRAGVREIVVFATHGLFTGERWRALPALGVRRIYTTDSVPSARELPAELVEVLPIGSMLLDAFLARAGEEGAGADAAPAGTVVERVEGPAPTEDSSVP